MSSRRTHAQSLDTFDLDGNFTRIPGEVTSHWKKKSTKLRLPFLGFKNGEKNNLDFTGITKKIDLGWSSGSWSSQFYYARFGPLKDYCVHGIWKQQLFGSLSFCVPIWTALEVRFKCRRLLIQNALPNIWSTGVILINPRSWAVDCFTINIKPLSYLTKSLFIDGRYLSIMRRPWW